MFIFLHGTFDELTLFFHSYQTLKSLSLWLWSEGTWHWDDFPTTQNYGPGRETENTTVPGQEYKSLIWKVTELTKTGLVWVNVLHLDIPFIL